MKHLLVYTVCAFAFLGLASTAAAEGADLHKARVRFDAAALPILEAAFEFPQDLCSGTVRINLPSLGQCPQRAGYVSIGFATCIQEHRVPKKVTFKVNENGLLILDCVIDLSGAEPVGDPVCDYSDCFYIEEPEWPGPLPVYQ